MTNKFLKFVSFITALCVLLGVMPIFAFAGEELYYAEDDSFVYFSPETELPASTSTSTKKFYSNGAQVDTSRYFYNQLTGNQKELYNLKSHNF